MTTETHPMQVKRGGHLPPGRVPKVVSMRAYEVYCEVFSPQEALVTGGCRGGFSSGEIIAFLYARSFPKQEWNARFREALQGLQA